MKELIWRHGHYVNPRLHYLYRGNDCLGMVSMLGNHNGPIRGYSVYQQTNGFEAVPCKFLAVMPTLDEAKDLLQTITGAQL
jgi:hypothetical protein